MVVKQILEAAECAHRIEEIACIDRLGRNTNRSKLRFMKVDFYSTQAASESIRNSKFLAYYSLFSDIYISRQMKRQM